MGEQSFSKERHNILGKQKVRGAVFILRGVGGSDRKFAVQRKGMLGIILGATFTMRFDSPTASALS